LVVFGDAEFSDIARHDVRNSEAIVFLPKNQRGLVDALKGITYERNHILLPERVGPDVLFTLWVVPPGCLDLREDVVSYRDVRGSGAQVQILENLE
jgi:hypothetical protein